MKSKFYKIIGICAVVGCMVITSLSIVSAAEPSIKVISTTGSNTSAKIYLENISSDTAGIQFDLTAGNNKGFQMKEWNPMLNSQFTHVKEDGNKFSFYITGDLPISGDSLYIGNAVFKGSNVKIGTTGYMKYLDSNLDSAEQDKSTISVSNKTTGNSDDDDSSSSSGGGSSSNTPPVTKPTDKVEKEDAKKEDEKNDVTVEVIEVNLKDIQGHWGENSIMFVVENGIMAGMGEDKFEPNGLLTRAMLIKTIYNIESLSESNMPSAVNMNFADVPANEWYAEAVNWAASNKITSGMGDNRFEPNATITREQAATMITNYCKYKNIELPKLSQAVVFSDVGSIQSWAKESVNYVAEVGLMSGRPDNTFDPQGNATRAEVASIIERFVKTAKIEFK